jgi:DNA-binding transcriptional ArsR family regulator
MEANVATVAALIGDPSRAAMLSALLGGRSEPASTLARMAGASPQAASHHLARLVEGGLISVQTEGRHRYYRLAGAEVAHALEALACLTPPPVALSPKARALREARSCYSHLAGRLGVAVTEALIERGLIELKGEQAFAATAAGRPWFEALEVDPGLVGKRCLDWTERRPHLAGPLGVALLARFKANGWVRAGVLDRSMTLTAAGRAALSRRLGLDFAPATAAA